jgi:hypothetical protein
VGDASAEFAEVVGPMSVRHASALFARIVGLERTVVGDLSPVVLAVDPHESDVTCNHRMEFSVDDPAVNSWQDSCRNGPWTRAFSACSARSKLPAKHARTDTKSHRAIE